MISELLQNKSEALSLSATKQKKTRESNRGDRVFARLLYLPVAALIILIGSFFVFLLRAALPNFERQGFTFFTSSVWDPIQEVYGALPVIFGTIYSSAIAIVIATPLSIGIALFLCEVANKRVALVVGFLVEMLASIPSIVYGLWGIFVLAPWLRTSVEPILKKSLGFLPLFQGPPFGVGMLAAGIILAIMIIPTISSVCREVFLAIPNIQKEAALGLGATRWEMMWLTIVKSSISGIWGSVILGLGRALGETMAVTMVIGNRHEISASLFSPGSTMASIIANQYAEASSDGQISALVAVGLSLFIVGFFINSIAHLWLRRIARKNPS